MTAFSTHKKRLTPPPHVPKTPFRAPHRVHNPKRPLRCPKQRERRRPASRGRETTDGTRIKQTFPNLFVVFFFESRIVNSRGTLWFGSRPRVRKFSIPLGNSHPDRVRCPVSRRVRRSEFPPRVRPRTIGVSDPPLPRALDANRDVTDRTAASCASISRERPRNAALPDCVHFVCVFGIVHTMSFYWSIWALVEDNLCHSFEHTRAVSMFSIERVVWCSVSVPQSSSSSWWWWW